MRSGAGHKIQRGLPFAPCRGAQTLHAPALLIHRNHRIAAHRIAHIIAQGADLIGRVDVARKQDETERIDFPEKRFLVDT